MKPTLTDMIISYLLKGGVLLETRGDFETEIIIPFKDYEGESKGLEMKIRCKDLSIRTIKPERGEKI